MTTEEERQARIAAFDAEADRPREGWIQEPQRGSLELWERKYPGGFLGTVHCWPDGEVTFVLYDQQGRQITGGKSSRRGWAMDGCDEAGRSNLN